MTVTPRQLELALKKQRLQLKSAALRDTLADQARGVQPLFTLVERGRAAARWLRRHPALPVGILVALLVARPRGALRWGRRAWLAWASLRKVKDFLGTQLHAGHS